MKIIRKRSVIAMAGKYRVFHKGNKYLLKNNGEIEIDVDAGDELYFDVGIMTKKIKIDTSKESDIVISISKLNYICVYSLALSVLAMYATGGMQIFILTMVASFILMTYVTFTGNTVSVTYK